MKNILYILTVIVLTGCSTSVKVLSAWKSDDVNELKSKNILVIARTANTEVREDFEISIANTLRANGYKATESFTRFPKLNPDEKMTKEKEKLIRDILGYEGYDAVCISVLKDYSKTETTHYYNNFAEAGMMDAYSSYYPEYYGGFYNYYMNPYSYSTFGAYYGTSNYTSTDKKYVLETLFYNLDKKEGDQLLSVTTTKITNPKEAGKTADKYTEKIIKSLSKL